MGMHEMTVYGVNFDLMSSQPIVLLKSNSENRYLPIWIGHFEAGAILMRLQDTVLPRPLTHDLALSMLHSLGARIEKVTVTDIRDGTYYALITIRQGSESLDIDARPSDAIALAVRAEAPIFASDKIIDEATVILDEDASLEDEVDRFVEFLETVTPEDFSRPPEE